jgi:hypothetical protein
VGKATLVSVFMTFTKEYVYLSQKLFSLTASSLKNEIIGWWDLQLIIVAQLYLYVRFFFI